MAIKTMNHLFANLIKTVQDVYGKILRFILGHERGPAYSAQGWGNLTLN